MKVLIDECAPRALMNFLNKRGHESLTVQEAGWAGKQNGELLTLAEAEFDVLLSVDTNLTYQQNLVGHSVAKVVLHCSSNRLDHLRQHFPACASAVERIKPGEIIHVGDMKWGLEWNHSFANLQAREKSTRKRACITIAPDTTTRMLGGFSARTRLALQVEATFIRTWADLRRT